ncbi:MAG: AAA family ATPase [Pseudomonadota bacterium]
MTQESTRLHSRIALHSTRLAQVGAELKAELFGIDQVIDRVIESVRAWYVLPDIISRPVIVCLWGLTGTGKTQLTRSLAQKLGFYDRFVEVQMDGFSNGASPRTSSISGMLGNSGIEESAPGILVLDEFQRYRTLDSKGKDIKVERYQDVWTLLSDGRLPPALSFMTDIESSLAYSHYEQERDKDDADGKPARKYRLSPYEAREFKQSMKLKEPLMEIMCWTPDEIHLRLQAFREQKSSWETDFSKLLVFVCGNLDEMYEETAKRVEDCDTDADIFHALTKRLSIVDVKRALSERFKPEQIARLGNNHVIYPSFSRATYQKLIAANCERYVSDIQQSSGLRFTVSQALQAEIYANAVFPAQGTRPLYSSIHAILSAPLVSATLWALEHGAQTGDVLELTLDAGRKNLLLRFGELSWLCPVKLELNQLKQRANTDFRALLAVHEAGHGLIYALLFGQPPQEIKINVASFDGGYNSFSSLRASSSRNSLDMICVGLGGRAAESIVFGDEACTTGAEHDLKQATEDAARYVRHHGFGGRLSRTDVSHEKDDNLNTAVEPTNQEMETILALQYERAKQLLDDNSALFMQITQALVENGEVPKQTLAEWMGLSLRAEPGVLEPYARKLADFVLARKQPVPVLSPPLAYEVEQMVA